MQKTDYATANDAGVVKVGAGLTISNGAIATSPAGSYYIKNGSAQNQPVVPYRQHESTFYGLAKAAGDATQSASSNPVGTYTADAKAAIKSMIGVNVDDVQVNGTSVVSSGVANIPIAGEGTLGLVRGDMTNSNIYVDDQTGTMFIIPASAAKVKAGTDMMSPIVPHETAETAFYGMAKAAGDTTQKASSNPIGTYTDNAKTAIQTMLGVASSAEGLPSGGTTGQVLKKQSNTDFDAIWANESGAVTDVQINSTSILSQGVANIPTAAYNVLGAAKVDATYGINANSSGRLYISTAGSSVVKGGTNTFQPISPSVQHESTFYGLAKAAGDSTQSASANAVGTYTETAKSKISDMLNAPETVSGSTPSITAKSGIMYVCGEVATLDITLPASGTFGVRFESGSTPTVLTATGVTWPSWFDPTSLEADTIYEINVSDGYGLVATWPS